ncbi:MAG: DUF5686 and carboxypeptidase regulatory-like domain-containing protein [Ignavibacteriaceae bacterium]|nr:DUF5686 and carboxypeptidase regulatory-like domain-containing protein [Ignavibacteriaceae bacterium]MCW8824783.1 DUF5686 and carboxypeptidase regulatory-like domain-containing protein [Ignavibacteriaceae bacterium]
MYIKYCLIALFFFPSLIYSQTLSLSGGISDSQSGNALPYANVRVLNTTLGTAANINGEFELKLARGSYTLVASYIGYYSDTATVELSSNLRGVNFSLTKTDILLPEIVILPGENPALAVIRKAIEKKKERNKKLNTYEFEAYTKGLIRTTDEISARGRTVSAGVGAGEDSADLKITGILENQSKGYFKKPDQFKETIIARKQSANFPPTINTITGGRLIQNFYEDNIAFFGGDLPGPISEDALDYYYYYIDKVVLKNNRKVFKLFMKPKSSDDPGFIGSIFINDSTFELIQVELELNRAANPGGIFDTISIFQQFTSYDDIYMPADYRLFAKGNFLGLARFGFELNTILYDYKINPELSEDIFTKAIVTVVPDADKKDSLYWTSTQTIPNTNEEDKAYKRIDSLRNVPVTFWDQFSWLSTRTYFSENFAINGTLNLWRFNSVEGFTPRLGFYFEDDLDQRLNSSVDLAYGFSDKRFKTDFAFEYLLGDYRTTSINFNAYNSIKILFGSSDEYADLTASLLALLNKEEFRNYYYSAGFDFKVESEVFPVLALSAGFLNRKDKSAQNNTDFAFFRKDKEYHVNPLIYETSINAITAGFKLDFRDYIEDGYFRRRTSLGKSYTNFSGDVTYSNSDWLGSDLEFTTYRLYIDNFTRTFRSAFLNIKLFGMYNFGALPYQDMYALPGNINLLSKSFTFRTLRVNEIFGERVATLNLEYNLRDELFKLLRIPGFKDWEITLNLFYNSAVTEIGDESASLLPVKIETFNKPFYEIGFGLGQGIIPLELEFAWKLNYRGSNNFVISLNTFAF